jgi:hypothetical protein
LPSIYEPSDRSAVLMPIDHRLDDEIDPDVERPSAQPGVARPTDQQRRAPAASPAGSERRRVRPERGRPPDEVVEIAEPRVRRVRKRGDLVEPTRGTEGLAPVEAARSAADPEGLQAGAIEETRQVAAPSPPAPAPMPQTPPIPARVPDAQPPREPGPVGDVDRPPALPRTRPPTASQIATDRRPEPAVSIQPASIPPISPVVGSRRLRMARSADPPIVRITIGRIDVRAVPPEAPTEVKKPPTRRRPAMSLEDYLKRRNGRGS